MRDSVLKTLRWVLVVLAPLLVMLAAQFVASRIEDSACSRLSNDGWSCEVWRTDERFAMYEMITTLLFAAVPSIAVVAAAFAAPSSRNWVAVAVFALFLIITTLVSQNGALPVFFYLANLSSFAITIAICIRFRNCAGKEKGRMLSNEPTYK